MRRVRRQIEQLNVGNLGKLFYQPILLVPGIIKHNRDWNLKVQLGYLNQHQVDAVRVDVGLVSDGEHFLGERIDRTKDIEALSS